MFVHAVSAISISVAFSYLFFRATYNVHHHANMHCTTRCAWYCAHAHEPQELCVRSFKKIPPTLYLMKKFATNSRQIRLFSKLQEKVLQI